MTDFNPTDIATIGHNAPPEPAHIAIFQEIDDLFAEAKNFADGEPIESDALHDAMTELRDRLHKAGAAAEALRVETKKPHDEAIAAIQATFNPYVQKDKGKVALGKLAIDSLTGAWRVAKAAAAQAEARRIAEEAAEAKRLADAAIQSSSGNLAARAEAEELLAEAKRLEKTAKRTEKSATTGTGLVTRWVAVMVDEGAALDWAYARAKDEFLAVVQSNADAAVRGGVRVVPGFLVEEQKVAR